MKHPSKRDYTDLLVMALWVLGIIISIVTRNLAAGIAYVCCIILSYGFLRMGHLVDSINAEANKLNEENNRLSAECTHLTEMNQILTENNRLLMRENNR